MDTQSLVVTDETTPQDIQDFLDEHYLADTAVISIDLGLPIMAYVTRDANERQIVVLRSGDIEKRFPRSVGEDRSEDSITIQGQGGVDSIIVPFRERDDRLTWKGCAYINPNQDRAHATFTIYPAKVKASGTDLVEMVESARSTVKERIVDRLLN